VFFCGFQRACRLEIINNYPSSPGGASLILAFVLWSRTHRVFSFCALLLLFSLAFRLAPDAIVGDEFASLLQVRLIN